MRPFSSFVLLFILFHFVHVGMARATDFAPVADAGTNLQAVTTDPDASPASVPSDSAAENDDEGVPVPLPGEDASIPLPGDEAPIPMPGDDAVPLPGEQAAVPRPSFAPGKMAGNSPFPWDFGGYIEDTLNVEYQERNGREFVLNAARMRLNLSGKPDPHFDFGIGVIGTLFTGGTEAELAAYLPDGDRRALVTGEDTLAAIRQWTEMDPAYDYLLAGAVAPDGSSRLPGAADFYRYNMENEIYLQEAFGTLYVPYFRLRVGRHKFYTGTGYAYNPIDLFNRKDPLDPTYETNGMDALFLAFELPAEIEIQGLVRVSERFKNADYLGRFKGSVEGWDFAFQYTHQLRSRMDWESMNRADSVVGILAGEPLEAFERRFRWQLAAAELAGQIWEIGFHAEGGYAFIESEGDPGTLRRAAKNHERLLVGLDYTFEFQLYLMAEYLRIGQGRGGSSEIGLNDRLAYYTGEILAIDKNSVFAGMSYPLTDLIEMSLYAVVACDSPAAVLNPWLIFDLYPGLKLSLTASVPLGSDEGQNGHIGPGGFARLRFSF